MTGTPPAQDYHEVVLPGELDFRTRDRRLVEGIPVDDSVWNLILESARKVDVSISEEA
jgi:LDH2 family malate/lactate/ureidoglycolate dehydrogenase